VIIHQHGIEAARRDIRKVGEILLRGADDALLFARIDAGRMIKSISPKRPR